MSPERKEFLSVWLKAGHRIFDHWPLIKKTAAVVGSGAAAGLSKLAYDRFKRGRS